MTNTSPWPLSPHRGTANNALRWFIQSTLLSTSLPAHLLPQGA
jgi:hypothetical protein